MLLFSFARPCERLEFALDRCESLLPTERFCTAQGWCWAVGWARGLTGLPVTLGRLVATLAMMGLQVPCALGSSWHGRDQEFWPHRWGWASPGSGSPFGSAGSTAAVAHIHYPVMGECSKNGTQRKEYITGNYL